MIYLHPPRQYWCWLCRLETVVWATNAQWNYMRLSCPVPSCLTGGIGGNVFMFYARRLLKLLSVQHIPWRIVSLNFNGLKKLSAEFLVVVFVVVAATFDRDDTRHMCAVLLCVSMCIRGYCSYVSYVKHVVGSILIKYNVCGWLPIMTRAQSFFCRFWFSGICWLETTKKEHAQIRTTKIGLHSVYDIC